MEKKTLSTIVFILALLFSAIAVVLSNKAVTANPVPYLPNITIKSDGSVEPQTELIRQTGNVYSLTADLSQNYAIKIQRSNIILDGGGHSINGSPLVPYPYGYFFGLRIESVTNVTIKNIRVTGCMIDIFTENTANSSFLRVETYRFQLENSDFNTIAESTMLGRVNIYNSNNNTFRGNSFYSTLSPLGNFNMFFENNFFRKYEGIGVGGFWDNGSVGNYWVDYEGVDKNGDGIGDTPELLWDSQDHYPLMNPWDPIIPFDTVPPRISISSPKHMVYNDSRVPLTFVIYESSSSMSYSLDGQDNVTFVGNTTLSGLPNGEHSLAVFVTDQSGNVGVSDSVYFSVEVPFPVAPVVVASVAIVAVVGVALLVYRRKRHREALTP